MKDLKSTKKCNLQAVFCLYAIKTYCLKLRNNTEPVKLKKCSEW